MFEVITSTRDSLTEKNLWLLENHNATNDADYTWSYLLPHFDDYQDTKILHKFKDENLAVLFALRWT